MGWTSNLDKGSIKCIQNFGQLMEGHLQNKVIDLRQIGHMN